jgi:hypothetical protein
MRVVMSGRAWVSYAQIYVESADNYADLGECFAGQRNGLCGAAVEGNLFLITGLHTGKVGFTVEVHDSMPRSVDHDAEEIVEASYRPLGEAALVGWGGEGNWPLDLDPMSYRVRYSAWGMDEGHQANGPMDDEPLVDRYLLQFWPAPPAPDRVIRQTSRQAAYWHKYAREQPTPAQLAQQKQEKARRAEEQKLAERAAAWGGALPTERIEHTRFAQQLSRLDRPLVDALEQTEPETLRSIARWVVRRACEQAGYAGDERIAGVLGRMDRGASWLETLNGPPRPVEPGAQARATLQFVDRPHEWNDRLDPFENTTMVVTAALDEDPLQAAIGATWLGLGPFVDKQRLLSELRQRFLTSPSL